MELFLEGLRITGFSMAIVFTVLIVIMFLIKIETLLLSKERKNKQADEGNITNTEIITKKEEVIEEEDKDEELVAVIMAAISSFMDNEGMEFKIKSIKRINNSDSAWRRAGMR
ncbi:OadG family protein [Clostridium sp. MSJ-4]|uniref:OadG family protein n=1 Tax=Clostridium simiarum TaxID=2841506 RepID=A0ABS6F2G7_9CLOT|nr:OadG family protein [Clostridium simiarum]MBU5592085.1 OadG family protein [Clostridium simiarum]